MKLLLVVIIVCISLSATGQRKIHFSMQNYFGLLSGKSGSKAQAQTINGIRYKSWFVGVGIGVDWYYSRSFPLFISLNRNFFVKRNHGYFVNADGGLNFASVQHEQYGLNISHRYIPSLYYAVGIGYKKSFKKSNHGLFIQAGYSYKHIREELEPSYPSASEYYDSRLERFSVKIGWGF